MFMEAAFTVGYIFAINLVNSGPTIAARTADDIGDSHGFDCAGIRRI